MDIFEFVVEYSIIKLEALGKRIPPPPPHFPEKTFVVVVVVVVVVVIVIVEKYLLEREHFGGLSSSFAE